MKRTSRPAGTDSGFSLMEVVIAVSLLAATGVIFATMFAKQAATNRSVKSVGLRDLGYYQVGRFAGDPSALLMTYYLSNAGSTGVKLNPCFRTCLDLSAPNTGCNATAVPTERCLSWLSSSTGRQLQWYPLSVFNPVKMTQVAGPNFQTYATYTNPDTRPVVRYTVNGEICPSATQPDYRCPIQAVTEFSPVCPSLGQYCRQMTSFVVRYTVRWIPTTGTGSTTDTRVERPLAAFRSMSNSIETPTCQIVGFSSCPGFPYSPTVAQTSTNTYVYTVGSTSTVTGTCTTPSATCTTVNGNTGLCSGCFVAGTPVETEYGPLPIERVERDMRVWSVSPGGQLELARVSAVSSRRVPFHVRMTLEDGREIHTTFEHPFWSWGRGREADYYRVDELRPGDPVLELSPVARADEDRAMEPARIRSIEVVEGEVRVHNMTVEGNQSYFAQGVLVHNKVNYCVE